MNEIETIIERTEAAAVAMKEALETIQIQRDQLSALNDLASRLHEWSLRHGAELVPPGGWHDTYGDGMRYAKQTVSIMVAGTISDIRDIAMRRD